LHDDVLPSTTVPRRSPPPDHDALTAALTEGRWQLFS
jgi:hypothetical protein